MAIQDDILNFLKQQQNSGQMSNLGLNPSTLSKTNPVNKLNNPDGSNQYNTITENTPSVMNTTTNAQNSLTVPQVPSQISKNVLNGYAGINAPKDNTPQQSILDNFPTVRNTWEDNYNTMKNGSGAISVPLGIGANIVQTLPAVAWDALGGVGKDLNSIRKSASDYWFGESRPQNQGMLSTANSKAQPVQDTPLLPASTPDLTTGRPVIQGDKQQLAQYIDNYVNKQSENAVVQHWKPQTPIETVRYSGDPRQDQIDNYRKQLVGMLGNTNDQIAHANFVLENYTRGPELANAKNVIAQATEQRNKILSGLGSFMGNEQSGLQNTQLTNQKGQIDNKNMADRLQLENQLAVNRLKNDPNNASAKLKLEALQSYQTLGNQLSSMDMNSPEAKLILNKMQLIGTLAGINSKSQQDEFTPIEETIKSTDSMGNPISENKTIGTVNKRTGERKLFDNNNGQPSLSDVQKALKDIDTKAKAKGWKDSDVNAIKKQLLQQYNLG